MSHDDPAPEEFGPEGGTISCPQSCDVPTGQRLVQVLTEPKPFAFQCPNYCGRWVRAVPLAEPARLSEDVQRGTPDPMEDQP